MLKNNNHHISIPVNIDNKILFSMLHSKFNFDNKTLFVLIPGLLGDRSDSRFMMNHIADTISEKGGNCLRISYYGTDFNEGDYFENNRLQIPKLINTQINNVTKKFNWMDSVIFIAFSEGLKFCLNASQYRNDVIKIISCNGILNDYNMDNNVTSKVKKKGNHYVFNSNFGLWCNIDFLKNTNYMENNKLNIEKDIKNIIGIYGSQDTLTTNTQKYFKEKKIPTYIIEEAEHLFTTTKHFDNFMDVLEEVITTFINCDRKVKEEIFCVEEQTSVFIQSKDFDSKRIFLFIPPLFCTKSGPNSLFNNIIQNTILENSNVLSYDLYGHADSHGDIKNISINCLERQLEGIIKNVSHKYEEVITISIGLGNIIVNSENIKVTKKILLNPMSYDLYSPLSTNDKEKEYIDTSLFFEKYKHCSYMIENIGHIKNRSSGFLIPTRFLKDIKNRRMNMNFPNVIIVNTKEKSLMDCINRDELILKVNEVLKYC